MHYFLNLLSNFFPPNRLYIFKKFLYKLSGLCVGINTKFGNRLKIYGKGKIIIGDNVWLGNGVEFYVPIPATINIGSNCDFGPGVRFYCGTHKVGNQSQRAGQGLVDDIYIGSGVWVGGSSIFLPGSHLGDGIVVAAGSVVIKGSYPSNCLLTGNPAIVKKFYE